MRERRYYKSTFGWNRSGWPPLAWIPPRVVHLRVKVLAARTRANTHKLLHRFARAYTFYPTGGTSPSFSPFFSLHPLNLCDNPKYRRKREMKIQPMTNVALIIIENSSEMKEPASSFGHHREIFRKFNDRFSKEDSMESLHQVERR